MSFDYNRLSNMIKYKMCACVLSRVFQILLLFSAIVKLNIEVIIKRKNVRYIILYVWILPLDIDNIKYFKIEISFIGVLFLVSSF